ncbi:hypothetical protein OBP_273 [Pseudomonas phage OBP]|uniref:hypothetical protein n=1 Tax=Pseudomonas phage OBP TaxID=1124849 RepID=UPI000240D5FA|nr:hypothetical protein OBP_273 [Pseudomonas phage OBP]AEV89710.1 hypothetical protein OBP_273 [Pseudomonas phage OBP]
MNDKKKALSFGKNKNFVPPEQLTDVPSRLFRKITQVLDINMAKWKTYLDDYLRWIHPDDSGPAADVKRNRSTAMGNIQSTLFFSKTLSWNKLLMGLKIAKIAEIEVIFKIKTESGEEHVITEKTILRKSPRGSGED